MKIQRALFVTRQEQAALRVALRAVLRNFEGTAPRGEKTEEYKVVMQRMLKDLEEDK